MRYFAIFIGVFLISCSHEYPKAYSIDVTGNKITTNDSIGKEYLDKIPRITEALGNDYEAFLYDERKIGKNKAVFIKIGRDAYQVIYLLILNEKGSLINTFEVAGDDCPGANELEDGSVKWCGDKFSVFENDSVFSLTNKKIKTDSFFEDTRCYIDSTVTKYKISYSGNIEKLWEENVHFERVGVSNVQKSE